jgi:hypothetical protein
MLYILAASQRPVALPATQLRTFQSEAQMQCASQSLFGIARVFGIMPLMVVLTAKRLMLVLGKALGKRSIVATLSLCLVAANFAALASDLPDTPPDSWWWFYGQTPQQVESLLSANNGRLISIQVEQKSPLLLTVAMVRNSGPYAKTWWWYYGQSEIDIASHARELNARIINLDAYEVNGKTYFAAIFISNSGNDAKAWWWYYGQTPDQIGSLVQQHNARLVDLRQYVVSGATRYAAAMIANTGADATPWWWYFDISAAQVSSNLQQNGAYLTSLQVANASGPTFNVIMNRLPTPGRNGWWWYYGQTAAELTNLYTQHAAWLTNVKTYSLNRKRVFTALLLGGMPPPPPVNVLTQHNDNQRTGANLNETTLLPSLLSAGRFGFLFARNVDGQPYAQPLYVSGLNIPGKGVHNVVFVATTLNYVYAFDADDPAQSDPLWRSQQLGTPARRAHFVPFKLIDPAIGIASTPVIDLASGTLYVVAKSRTMEAVFGVQELQPGNRILLESLGDVPGPRRWLDGRTQDQTVALASTTDFPFTGTVWELGRVENGAFTLRSLGHLVGQRIDNNSHNRYPYELYLDGRTQFATVAMAACTNDQPPPPTGACLPVFTGTRWDIIAAGQGTFNLKNRGAIDGPPWLDGRTDNGTVGLAPTTGGGFTGTRWRLHRLSFHHHLYALDLATGRVKQSVEIKGSARDVTFDPTWQLNRAGLLLLNNAVYIAFGAHADAGPWHGWVFGYDATTLKPVGVYVTTPAINRTTTPPTFNSGGGIWQAGNGLVGDTAGNVYFMTGNGSALGPPPPEDLRNSFVKLRSSGGALTPSGWYPPQHRPELDWCDIDLGSAGPVQLPGTRRLAGAGKEGVLYLLDMDTMAGLQQFQATSIEYDRQTDPPRACPNRPDFEVMRYYPHVHGSPVTWPQQTPDTLIVYLWAEQDRVRAFRYEHGRFRTEPVARSALRAPQNSMPGGVLSLSANGTTPETGTLWATRPSDCAQNEPNNTVANMVYRACNGEENVVRGILHAFHAGTLEEVWNSDWPGNPPLGNLAKFAPPTIAAGKVYIGTFGDPGQCSDQRCPSQLKVYGVR